MKMKTDDWTLDSATIGATHYQEDEDFNIWYYKKGFMWFGGCWIPTLGWYDVELSAKPL